MQYNGGKHSCSKEISEIIGNIEGIYWEPFVGAANVISRVSADIRIGSDKERAMIRLWNAVKQGFSFPENVSYEEYQHERIYGDPDTAIHAFIKYGCSFGGKPWGGYARSKGRNYALNASRSLNKIRESIMDVSFIPGDYRTLQIEADVVYCDPPYEGTTSVGCSGKFDSKEFWEWAETYKCSRMLVSELKCPDNGKWKCVFVKSLADGLGASKLTEKVFERIC